MTELAKKLQAVINASKNITRTEKEKRADTEKGKTIQ